MIKAFKEDIKPLEGDKLVQQKMNTELKHVRRQLKDLKELTRDFYTFVSKNMKLK